MRKKFTGVVASMFLVLFSGTALSQLSPPFRPLQPSATTTQKYTSNQYKFSFDYPQGWKVGEEQGVVSVNEPQNLAWISMWRITQSVDPQNYLQNIESQLKQQWQNYTVTSRGNVKIDGVDALRVDGEATSQEKVWVFTLLVLYENNQAKLMVGSGVVKEQYTNLSSVLEQIFGSITFSEEGAPSQSQQPAETTPRSGERPAPSSQAPQASGDGSEGIKILRDSARGANPLPYPQTKPPSNWVHFAHPTIFMLKLIHPPDWKEEIMQDPSGYYGGLKIISPDSQANLFVYYAVNFGATTVDEGIREGIYLLTNSQPEVEVLVRDDLRKVVSALWPGAESLFVAFRSQGKVGVLLCITFPHGQGVSAATSVQLKGCIGPADKFDNLVKEVFYKVFGWVGAGGYITPAPRG